MWTRSSTTTCACPRRVGTTSGAGKPAARRCASRPASKAACSAVFPPCERRSTYEPVVVSTKYEALVEPEGVRRQSRQVPTSYRRCRTRTSCPRSAAGACGRPPTRGPGGRSPGGAGGTGARGAVPGSAVLTLLLLGVRALVGCCRRHRSRYRPARCTSCVVGPGLDHLAVLQHDDDVGRAHRLEPVGDQEGGATARGLEQPGLHLGLGVGVQPGRRLVEQQERGVAQDGPGDGQPLALPARQGLAAVAQHRVVAVGQRHHEVVGAGQPGGLLDLRAGGAGPGVPDVLAHRGPEQHRALHHHGDLRAQRVGLQLADVVAVDEHPAAGGDGQPAQQRQQRRLPGPRRAHDPDQVPGRHRQGHVAQDGGVAAVRGVHALEDDLPAQRRGGHGGGPVLGGRGGEDLRQALGADAGPAQGGPELAQRLRRPEHVADVRGEHDQVPGGQGAAQDPLGADPHQTRQCRRGHQLEDAGEQRGDPRHAQLGAQRGAGARGEAVGLEPLVAEGLDEPDRRQHLLGLRGELALDLAHVLLHGLDPGAEALHHDQEQRDEDEAARR